MKSDTERGLVVTHLVKAPVARVFEAWTRAEQLSRWLCPDPNARVEASVDCRPGGRFRVVMHMSTGAVHTVVGVYRVVHAPSHLAFTWDWEEPAAHMGDTLVQVDLASVADGTSVTVTHTGFPSDEACAMHDQGWRACLVRLRGE